MRTHFLDHVKNPRKAQGFVGFCQGGLPSDFKDNRFGITVAGLDIVRLGPHGRQKSWAAISNYNYGLTEPHWVDDILLLWPSSLL